MREAVIDRSKAWDGETLMKEKIMRVSESCVRERVEGSMDEKGKEYFVFFGAERQRLCSHSHTDTHTHAHTYPQDIKEKRRRRRKRGKACDCCFSN